MPPNVPGARPCKELPATIVLRDQDLDLAFIRPTAKPAAALVAINLADAETPSILEDLVVTNAHVVAGADTVEARLPDGSLLPATVVVFDPDRDLALLTVDDLPQEPLERATAEVGTVETALLARLTLARERPPP